MHKVILDKPSMNLQLPQPATSILLNDQDHAYFQQGLDNISAKFLADNVSQLEPVNQVVLLTNIYQSILSGKSPVSSLQNIFVALIFSQPDLQVF